MFESTGLLLGWIACTWFLANIIIGMYDGLRMVNNELHDKLIKRIDRMVHRVQIEQHDEQYYWYDQDNRDFLAQGRSTEEIIEKLKTRFPDHMFYFEDTHEVLCAKNNWLPKPFDLPKKS